jgi:hypothetical protein
VEKVFRGSLILTAFCLLLPFTVVAGLDRIDCFLIGSVAPGQCPLIHYFTEDPLFTYVADWQPSGLTVEERRKMDRLYYPRSKEIFSEKYDFVFFYDPRIDHFTTRQFADLDHVCRKAGMPSFWALSHGSETWYVASVFEILPISTIPLEGYYHRPWRVVFREERDPVFTPFISLGMEEVVGDAYAYMEPRLGAVVWADVHPGLSAWLASWKVEPTAGMSWAISDEFDIYWWGIAPETRGDNPYGIDLITNLVLYSMERPLIHDILTRREARDRISSFNSQKLLVISMLEWADLFGANTLELSEDLSSLDEEVTTALDHYLDQDYDSAIGAMDRVSLRVGEIGERAVTLKDQALLWVFTLEWLAVTSTALLTGVVLWTLMVRRRAFKPAGTTRMNPDY